jgi:uncharacterized phage protein (TIGR02218 family)
VTDISSAFFAKLQGDNVEIAEIIDLTLPNGTAFHWTTANGEITWTRSGTATKYVPFPGKPGGGIQEDISLGVSVIDFTMANSGAELQGQLLSSDFALAFLQVGRIFIDTPDLGRLDMYDGKIGDFQYDRLELTGQARNLWKSLNVQWTYYTYQDKCAWRFGSPGCGFNTASVTIALNSIEVGSSTTIDILLPAGTLSNSFANGRFDFGRATITGGTNDGAVRSIRAHTGDLISLSYVLSNPDLSGLTLSIHPGCKKRLLEDCKSLYNNDRNFLGFPWIPVQELAW